MTAGLLTARDPPRSLTKESLVAELRGFQPEAKKIFDQDDELVFTVTQPKLAPAIPVMSLDAFELRGGELIPLTMSETRIDDRERREIRLTATARIEALFPLTGGKKSIVFVVAGPGEARLRFAGGSFESLKRREELLWFEEELEVRPAALEARLLNQERIELRGDRPVRVFTREKLPRVCVRAASASGLQLRMQRGDDLQLLPTSTSTRGDVAILEVTELDLESAEDEMRLEVLHDGRVLAGWPIAWDRAEAEYRSSGWKAYFAEVELGRTYLRLEDLDNAWASWDRARVLAEELGSPTEVAGRIRSLAYLDLQAAKYTRAEEEIERARRMSHAVGDDTGVTRADYLAALLLDRRSGVVSALLSKKRYLDAIEAARRNGDEGDADKYALLLASSLAEHGSAGDARELLERIEPKSKNEKEWIAYAIHRAYVERAAFERGDGSADAARLRQDVLDDLDRVEAHPEATEHDRANLFSNLVRYDLALGDLDDAEAHLSKLEEYSRNDTGLLRALKPLLTAELDLARGRGEKVIRDLRAFQVMLEGSGESADLEVRDAAEALIGDALLQAGHRREAELAFRRAIDGGEERARTLASPRARARYRVQFVRAERHLIELLIGDRYAEAFELSEWLRVRDLLDLTAHARIARSPALFDRYLAAYRDLHSRYPRSCARAQPEEQEDCQALRVRLDVAVEELNHEVWRAKVDPRVDRSFHALEVLSTLPKKTAVLSIVALEDGRTAGFFVRDSAVEVHVGSKGEDPIEPWLEEIAALDRLFVSPSHRAAFDAPLRIIEGGGMLGAKLPILMLVYGEERRGIDRPSGALVIANPDGTLEHASQEGREVKEKLPDADLLCAEEATRGAVLGRWNVGVLHFAGHAELIAGDVWRPMLRLAGGEAITSEDVLVNPPPAWLVVLNACGTGVYQERGTIGLPDLFGRTADYVLASSSPALDDSGARAFVADFYRLGIKDPPESYRRALEAAAGRGDVSTAFRLWATVRRNSKSTHQ